MTARERPDVALVGLGESSDHALGLIEKIVQEAACPVIVLLHAPDPAFVKEASKRGIFAYITDGENTDWQSSIDIVLRRFAEYQDLEGAFGRRADHGAREGNPDGASLRGRRRRVRDAPRAFPLDEQEARGHRLRGGGRPPLCCRRSHRRPRRAR